MKKPMTGRGLKVFQGKERKCQVPDKPNRDLRAQVEEEIIPKASPSRRGEGIGLE